MCPWTSLRALGGNMSWETFEKIIPYLPLAREVDFTGGGEPLVNPRLPEMVRAAKEAGCQVGFSTNGSKLGAGMREQLLNLELDWISFSVDAAEAELYERIRQGARFETVIGNVAALNELKQARRSAHPRLMMVFVMMTGEQKNYHQLPDYIELAHSLGVERVIAKNLDVILKEADDQRRLFSHSKANPDGELNYVINQASRRAEILGVNLRLYALQPQEQAICEHDPVRNLFINWEGYVSPCITLSYAAERVFDGQRVLAPCQRFGNVNAASLESIWEGPAYRAFRQAYTLRQRAASQGLIDLFLDGSDAGDPALPPAPEGCRTCYYLYGI